MTETLTPAPEDLLRSVGLRVTAPRVAVLTELRERPHADVDTIAGASRERLGTVSTQAVYDVLKALVATGLARRFEPAGSPARYEVRTGDNHHHVVCRACGRIDDVPCATGSAPCLDPAESHGFVIDEAEVVYWGTCPACAHETPAPTASHPTHDHSHDPTHDKEH